MKPTIAEAYLMAAQPIVEQKTESLDESKGGIMPNLKKWESAGRNLAPSEKAGLKAIKEALYDFHSEIEDLADTLGDALSPGLKYTIKKDLKAYAETLARG